jgi:hypothetical protein
MQQQLSINKEQNNPKFLIKNRFVLFTKQRIKHPIRGNKIIENNINILRLKKNKKTRFELINPNSQS